MIWYSLFKKKKRYDIVWGLSTYGDDDEDW